MAALAMGACVQEQTGLNDGVETEVVFSLKADCSAETRAISDGTRIGKIIYIIVTEDGEFVCRGEKILASQFRGSTEFSMSVTLAGGCSYRAVFWAQSDQCDAYTLGDDMVLTVNYNGLNNDEHRDAFYGVSTAFTLADAQAEAVLKRPFAQLNAGTFPFDWEYVQEFHNFNVTRSAVRIGQVPSVLNLWDGTVSTPVDAIFQPGVLPQEMLMADVDENGTDEEYVYVSMSYVLASDQETVHPVEIYFVDDSNMAVRFENSRLEAVGLKRNCHTDFVGQVVTDSGELNRREFNVVDEVYYNVTEDTVISDKIYHMTDHGGLNFASESGQKMTLNNIFITGDIWTIELGEYRGVSYVNYVNELNNVTCHNLNATALINCHEWFFSPAIIAYGHTTLNNCTMTGATTVHDTTTDQHGVVHKVIPVDIGVRNESDAVVNGGTYDTFFAWTHAVVDIHGADIGTLYCGTCDSTDHSWMTIHSGTTIDSIICCEPRCPYGRLEYSTTMTIKAGAKIGSIQLVSTDVEFLIIESGAQVGKITCEGVEYTYEELRSAMGL